MTRDSGETDRNKRTVFFIALTVLGMLALSFAAVPLYDLFCRATGFGGTTQVSAEAPDIVPGRTITVKFNAATARDLPWKFKPEDRSIDIPLGGKHLTAYISENKSNKPVAGTALYNVTPPKAGKYFNKIQCFCFDEQILQPGEKMHMPVLFYLDPAFKDDPDMDDVSTITLSYTFFKTESEALEEALEAFYEGETPE